MEQNQQLLLQQSITNLLELIIKPFITTKTNTTTTTTIVDQAKLQEHSLAFSIQLHQSINQVIQQQQQQQHSPINIPIHRAQSEPNYPIQPKNNQPKRASSIQTTNIKQNNQDLTFHPTVSGDNPNYIQFDQDSISEDLRLYIQSEIEDGFNDLITQFDQVVNDAKHQLVLINRSLLESRLGKRNESEDKPNRVKPLSKIQVGSLGEKLKFEFESHLIDSYQDYLSRFSRAVRSTVLGETILDLEDDEQKQILKPSTRTQSTHEPSPNSNVVESIDDQKMEKIVTQKFEHYRTELQKHATHFRTQIQDQLKHYMETGSVELNETIDQIERILVREKDELMKLGKQIETLNDRVHQLETQVTNETNPILRRANVLNSLGLAPLTSNNESNQLQKNNLNIFLTFLNRYLKINLSQISINSNLDSSQDNINLVTESNQQPNHHQEVDPPDSNQPDLIALPKNDGLYLQQQQQQQQEEEFIDKFIINLITRIIEALTFYDNNNLDEHHCQTHYEAEQTNRQEEGMDVVQDIKNSKLDERVRQENAMDHQENRTTLHADQLLDHPPMMSMDRIKQIHLLLNHFSDLNFKKFVWPRFDPLVCQIEQYLISQQV